MRGSFGTTGYVVLAIYMAATVLLGLWGFPPTSSTIMYMRDKVEVTPQLAFVAAPKDITLLAAMPKERLTDVIVVAFFPWEKEGKQNMSLGLFRLDGKVAVIVGGARHLGYDMAEIFAEAGCDVAITSRKVEGAEAAAKKLREQYDRDAFARPLDVGDFAQVEALAQGKRTG